MSSQRHKLENYSTTSAGEVHAQGAIAPSIVSQVESTPVSNVMARSGEAWEVPAGAPGGPLQGSAISGAIPEGAPPPPQPEPEPEPGPDPEPGSEPTLTSIDPTTAVLDSADITLRCVGTNFTETSVIFFANQSEPAVFVSATELTTVVRPTLGWGPVTVQVWVQQGSFQTAVLDFTFTEASEATAEVETEAGALAPPFSIIRVEDDVDGIALIMPSGTGIHVGDTVLIEATGNTSVNGSYVVYAVKGTRIIVDNDYELTVPIEARGRVAVTVEA